MSDQNPAPEDPYFRPLQSFQCGSCEANCRLGPSPQGECRAGAQCEPVRRESRWICTRSAVWGGPCADGPFPDGSCCSQTESCVPHASVARRRRGWVAGLLALAVGVLMVTLGGPWRSLAVVPGPLCEQHGQLFRDVAGLQKCQACHAVADSSSDPWWAGLWQTDAQVGNIQSRKCLACHQEQIGPTPLLAHGVDRSQLDASSTRRNVSWPGQATVGSQGHGEWACATCHREHQGGDVDLTALSDRECQACHQSHFSGFAIDHPEFTGWPNSTDANLRFDHATHAGKHFAEKQRSFECRQCHLNDDLHNVQLLAPFAQACGECHESTIQVASLEGIPLFRLPRIDTSLASSPAQELGLWPAQATGFFDGSLPDWTLMFLLADDEAAAAFAGLNEETDWSLIDDTDPDQVHSALVIGRGLKRLMWEFSQRRSDTLRERLAKTTRLPSDSIAIQNVIEQLPYELLREAQQLWLPDLEFEVEANGMTSPRLDRRDLTLRDSEEKRAVSLVPKLAPALPDLQGAEPTTTPLPVSWPRPWSEEQELLAVNPLQEWAANELSKPQTGDSAEPKTNQQQAGPDVSAPAPILESNNNAESIGQDSNREYPRIAPAVGGTLLIENPLRSLRGKDAVGPGLTHAGSDGAPVIETPLDPAGGVDPPALADGSSGTETEAGEGVVSNLPEILEPSDPAPIWQYLAAYKTGWARDDRQLSLTYYPRGHADPLLVALHELRVAAQKQKRSPGTDVARARTPAVLVSLGAPANRLAPAPERLFEKLGGAAPIGDCTRCHQLEASNTGGNEPHLAAWKIDYRDPSRGQFTKFSHRPHLMLGREGECQACHELSVAENLAADANAATVHGHSDFKPFRLDQCASCHQKGLAPTRCTLCHDYHVGAQH